MTYDFEFQRISSFIDQHNISFLALQFPEGLVKFATSIASLIEHQNPSVTCLTMVDDCYGACCLEDRLALSMGIQGFVHFGHSQLFHSPLIPCLYIKTLIPSSAIATNPVFISLLNETSSQIKNIYPDITHIFLSSTTQFTALAVHVDNYLSSLGYSVDRPKCSPHLSDSECLGCTNSIKKGYKNALYLFLGDGSFHLEALSMVDPSARVARLDPVNFSFKFMNYDGNKLLEQRKSLFHKFQTRPCTFGVVVSTLGRQGSFSVSKRLCELSRKSHHLFHQVSVRDVSSDFLSSFEILDGIILIGCPRLALDWGSEFSVPILTAFEAFCLLDGKDLDSIPMDNFSECGGPWSNLF
ncbi:hypothetical protein RCL1_002994 [Eukaryota sp. TZLM3-RCL]